MQAAKNTRFIAILILIPLMLFLLECFSYFTSNILPQKKDYEPTYVFNFYESFFWCILAFGFLIKTIKSRRPLFLLIGIALLLFGVSDIVEMWSGAWWKPWWLLVWKAGCVIGLIYLFKNMFTDKQSSQTHDSSKTEKPFLD